MSISGYLVKHIWRTRKHHHKAGQVGDEVAKVVADEEEGELFTDAEVHERDEGGELEHVSSRNID
jgi:hypothetical protein